MSSNIRYNGLGGLDPYALAARLRLSSQPDYKQALKEARKAWGSNLPPEAKAEKYLAVCGADLMGHPLELTKFALAVLTLDVPAQPKETAVAYLRELTKQSARLAPEAKQGIKQLLRDFMTNQYSLALMRRQGYALKAEWTYIIAELFVTEFMDWQEALVWEVYTENPTPKKKFHAAQGYASLARIARHSGQSQLFDRVRVDGALEFLLGQNAADLLANRVIFPAAFFHHLIINLIALNRWAELARALAIRQPDSDDPILIVISLARTLEQAGVEAAAAALIELPLLKEPAAPIIREELDHLRTVITSRFLDTQTQPVWRSEAVLGNHKPWLKQALAEPISAFPGIWEALVRLRKDILKAKVQPTSQGDQETEPAQPLPRVETTSKVRDLAILNIDDKRLQVYLSCGQDGYVKVNFAFALRYADGSLRGVTGRAIFDGVSEEEAGSVSLGWEIRALTGLIACKKPRPELFADQQKAIEAEVARTARQLFEDSNRSAFGGLAARLGAEPEYQDTILIELENRTRLSRLILGGKLAVEQTLVFDLRKEDLLQGKIAKINLVPASRFEEYFELAGRQGDFGVIFETSDGGQIWALVNNPEELEIIGAKVGSRDLTLKYLHGLILEVLARRQQNGNGARKRGGASYVVDSEQQFGSDASHGLRALINILSRQFRRRLASQGLMAEDWYYLSNGLFRPLTDQSQNNKETARQTYGDKGLFVTAVPVCIKSRLPVREKVVDGEKILAPYEPDPQRLEQARLIGDNQTARIRFALYLVTTFSNGASHLRLLRIADAEAGLNQDGYLAQIESDISRGDFHAPHRLLEHDRSAKKNDLLRALTSGTVQITKQETRVWQVHYNLARPHFVAIADLLSQGYPLTV